VGGSVRRLRGVLAVSILAIMTALVAGSCWNPLNWALQTVGSMVEVQGGTLMLGNVEGYIDGYGDELPAHDVTLSTFQISRYEMTQEIYQEVMGSNPSWFRPYNGYHDEPSRPVELVTWQDAILFCNELSRRMGLDPVYTFESDDVTVTWDTSANGYRLPTEAEWEYAARGGQASAHYYLAGSDDENAVAWHSGNTTYDSTTDSFITRPVGELEPNELDLYDMSGNVCEWVWDGYSDAAYYQYLADCWNVSGFVPQDPPGPNMYSAPINQGIHYVARGGSTNSDWDLLRSAMRFGWDNDVTDYIDFGFRVVRNQ
jgi:sulfatase modifying factor 1